MIQRPLTSLEQRVLSIASEHEASSKPTSWHTLTICQRGWPQTGKVSTWPVQEIHYALRCLLFRGMIYRVRRGWYRLTEEGRKAA